jgi:predicted MPP superfamily phosphohydrolase
MRGIDPLSFFIVLAVYCTVSLLAWRVIRLILPVQLPVSMLSVKRVYFFLAIVQMLFFSFLFIGLNLSVSLSSNYNLYFYANAFLLSDFAFKIPLTVSLPFTALSGNEKAKKRIPLMGMILSVSVFLTLLWGIFFGIKTIEKKEITLGFESLPDSFDGFRIVQMSDFHFGSVISERILQNMVSESNRFRPHIVVFTGDLVNNHAKEALDRIGYLDSFSAEKGKYAIRGNHDYGDYSGWKDSIRKSVHFTEIRRILQSAGFHLLENESITIGSGLDSIYLVGVGNWGHPPFPRYTNLGKAESAIPDGAFRILLAHDPAFWDNKIRNDRRYSLCLSGHTHGFQWGIRFAGIQTSLFQLAGKRWGGLVKEEDRYLYVNRGTGIIGMALRIDMPAEITLITLRKM